MIAMPARIARIEFHTLIVLLFSFYPLAGALILPTLPLMQKALPGISATWIFSSLILGFGSTQILWGVMADLRGRRPALLVGLSLFTLASVGCFFASYAWQLFVLRFAQGAGVAAANVCARALMRDRYAGERAADILSLYFSWLGIAGLVGPFVAAYLIKSHGLGGALAAYAVFGSLAWILAAVRLSRLLDASLRVPAQEKKFHAIGKTWRRISRHPIFRMYLALTTFSYIGHYLFLTQSAFLLIDHFGWTVVDYGTVLSLCSLFYLGGTLCCRRVLPSIGTRTLVCWASVAGLAGAGGMVAAALADTGSGWWVVLPYMLFVFSHAIHQSCGQAAAMSPFRRCAAQAAGMLGTVLPLSAVLASAALKQCGVSSILALPICVGLSSVCIAAVAWTSVRRHGDIAAYRR